MLKLKELVPEEVASDVVELVARHVGRMVFLLGPELQVHLPNFVREGSGKNVMDPLSTEIGLTIQEVTQYAQSGAPHCSDAEVIDYLQSVCEACFAAVHPGVYGAIPFPWVAGLGEKGSDPDNVLDVILMAAYNRDQLEQRKPISARGLACLGSVSWATMRSYGSRGEVAISEGQVEAKEAIEWLAGQGVKIAGKKRQ